MYHRGCGWTRLALRGAYFLIYIDNCEAKMKEALAGISIKPSSTVVQSNRVMLINTCVKFILLCHV